jgi:hypothetical protein
VGREAWNGAERGLRSWQSAIAWLTVGLLALVLFAPALANIEIQEHMQDFTVHTDCAEEWYTAGALRTPHFLFPLLAIGVKWLFPQLLMLKAGIVVAVAADVAAALCVYAVLCHAAPPANLSQALVTAGVALGLLIVGPICLFTMHRLSLYMGYIWPASVYHNPTIALLRPIALAAFVCLAALLGGDELSRLARAGLAWAHALLLVLATLAKPNYTLSIVPALGLFLLLDVRTGRFRAVRWYALASLVPALAVLAWQYRFTYGTDDEGGVLFAPFMFMPDEPTAMLIKYVLSIVFPLLVTLVYWPEAKRRIDLRLAWTAFFVGTFWTYCFAEGGYRAHDYNFGWAAQITLFILFVLTAGLLLQEFWRTSVGLPGRVAFTPATGVLTAVFALHLTCGLIWYSVFLMGSRSALWYCDTAAPVWPRGHAAPQTREEHRSWA